MKKIIQSIVGAVLILVLAGWIFGVFANSKKAPQKKNEKSIRMVKTQLVKNQSLPIQITSTGSLLAKQRTVLFSEVQGVFKPTSKPYKPGVKYSAGQPLIYISNSEFVASVKSQRISFKSLLTGMLADIQFDYPEELESWKKYTQSISADEYLPVLPNTANENFSNYISGKSVYTNFYAIKNLETRLKKYTITAPFTGVLVTADVTPGTLISPGQKLGEFIKPDVYELELNVNASLRDFLTEGKEVKLTNIDHDENYIGIVSRVNSQIDRASQTVELFVEVKSDKLSEGEFLEADIGGQVIANAFEINRNLVIDQNHVFLVKDSLLIKHPIDIIHSGNNTLIVQGLGDNSELITIPVPGGYDGMKVAVKN